MARKKRSKKMRLDDRVVANLPFASRQYLVWDLANEGCGVRVSKTVKSCIIKIRMGKEKPKTDTIGTVCPATPFEFLQERAINKLRTLKQARRPKFIPEGELTLLEARDDYYTAHPDLKDSTREEYKEILNRDFGEWLNQPLMMMTTEAILKMNEVRIKQLAAADPVHKPPKGFWGWQASMRCARALVRWYAAIKQRPNPWPDRAALPMKKTRSRKLPVELQTIAGRRRLIEGLKAQDTRTARANRFICYTGFRRKESVKLTRAALVSNRVLDFQSKTRPLRVPLCRQAAELIDIHSETTLLGVGENQLRKSLNRIFGERILPSGKKKSCVTPHDLRRLFKTIGTELGIDPTIMNILVGHALKDVDPSYIDNIRLGILAAAVQKIADEIDNPTALPGEDEFFLLESGFSGPAKAASPGESAPVGPVHEADSYLVFPQPAANSHDIRLPHSHYLMRADLHQLVWTVPVAELAARFGLSDRGLAKLCSRADIPVPTRGYWSRIEAGQLIPPSPLPARPKGLMEPLRIRGRNPAPHPPKALTPVVVTAEPSASQEIIDQATAPPPPEVSQVAVSLCEEHREWIEAQVMLGQDAASIHQGLVKNFGFTHAYNSVKRFVRRLKNSQAITVAPAGKHQISTDGAAAPAAAAPLRQAA